MKCAKTPFRVEVLGIAAVLLLTSWASAQEATPSSETGCIRQWLVLGSIPCPENSNARQRVQLGHTTDLLGGEAALTPQAGDETAGKVWKAYTSPTDAISFAKALPGETTDYSVAYAYTTIHADQAGPAWLGLGSDDSVKVYFNGRLVHDHYITRGTVMDQDVVQVTFRKGENHLLLKVANGTGGWGMICRPVGQEKFLRYAQGQVAKADLSYASVFRDSTFPTIGLDVPEWAASSVGLPEIQVKFYNAEFQEVTQADKPGRYGAVVTVYPPADSKEAERIEYITLYKTDGDVTWTEAKVASAAIPSGLGIDPDVATTRAAQIASYASQGYANALWYPKEAAIFLAGLSEAADSSTNVYAQNNAWWKQFRKVHGIAEYKYLLDLPEDYDKDPNKKWPLVLFLHGAGERGTNVNNVRANGLPKLTGQGKTFPFILISPQAYRVGWQPDALIEFLDLMIEKYRIDTNRIYLTGLSMGGGGTWSLAAAYPERFAAVAPICGRSVPQQAERLKDKPIWVHHGAMDPTIRLTESTRMMEALQAVGSKAVLTVYPDAWHDSWTLTYSDDRLYEWMLSNSLDHPVWPDSSWADPTTQSNYVPKTKEEK